MAITKRFSGIDKAILVTTGNSLVVCGSTTEPANNTSDLIKVDGTTTRDWTEAGSSAILNLLDNSIILYAELVWYSTIFSNVSGALDLNSIQDNDITFTTTKGSYQITPQFKESNTSKSGTVDRFRCADVTTYVQDALSGAYTVSKVPISIPPGPTPDAPQRTGLSNSRGGWALSVIYRNNSFKPQKVIYNSGIAVATTSTPLQTAITGFTTASDQENLKGNVTLVCANGGPLNGQEVVSVGPSFAQLSNIGNPVYSPNPNPGKAPNNPGNSFFSGVINVANPLSESNGLLNITGSNGTHNNDGFVPTQSIGTRNKWDITNVDIANTLAANQTLLAGQIITGEAGDGIQLLAFGTQVLAKAPNITATLTSYDIDGDTEYNVEVEEALAYAIQIKNDGDVAANNVSVSAVLDVATSFVTGSVTVNGVANPTANIINGINIGSISAKGIVTVLFMIKVNSVPVGGLIYQNVSYNYQFVSGIENITNYGKTNTVQLIVQDGNLSITKSASKNSMKVNETVTYTINVKNVGTELAKDVFFQEKMDSNCSFVDGTVVIGGTPYPDYDPVAGFNLSDLPIYASRQIVFQVKVNSLPASTKVENISCVSFGYIFNQYGYPYKKTIFSNSTSIQIQYTDLIGQRCNDNNYPKVGDKVTYTLSWTNVGNIDATNVQVLEPTIPGASFISGSVKINGIIASNLNPFTGFILSDPIGPKATTNIEYKVLINSVDPANLIENIAKIPFKYQISQASTIIDSEKDSNTVDTMANYVCMNMTKSVDKSYALIGDILYYKVQVTNAGNINATDTVFLDSIQAEASFVSGTVAINGISYSQYNPNQGFTVGTICPEETVEVTFQVKVNTLPIPNIIYNNSSLVYGYKPDPKGNAISNTVFSNTVQTIINKAEYSIVKTVDKAYAQVGDLIVYTTTIKNTGTVSLTNVEFSDFLGMYLSLYAGSIYVNGINHPDYNLSNLIQLGDINPGDTAVVAFGATIVGNPPVGYIPNMSEVTLNYKENPNSPIISKTVASNEVRTYVPYASIVLVKSVDKPYAVVGDMLTYSFTATNNGTSTAFKTMFTDIIQTEASFVAGSVFINGVNKTDYNPETGFTLGDMVTGQAVTIEFKVTVNSLPKPNTIRNSATTSYSYYVDPNNQPITRNITSNTVTTIINSYSATLTKSVNKAYATTQDELDYAVVLTNTGTVTLSNVKFSDLIPIGATLVTGSVVVDGVSYPTANPNTGFAINDVPASGSTVVMFKAIVTNVPIPPQISNTAHVSLKYKLSPTSDYSSSNLTSNTVTTNIKSISVTNTKTVSKAYATVGDKLTYTSVIANKGNVSVENNIFIDTVPSGTTFVSGSVKINGTPYADYDPNKGFSLETIIAGGTSTVTFEVTVDSVPANGYVNNSSIINYQYKVEPTAPYISSSATSNTVTTYINLGDLNITKTADRTTVRLDDVINYSLVISNTGNTILRNIVFKDIIQTESLLKSGTVYVNGIKMPDSYDPSNGFSINDIPIGQQTTVSFAVIAKTIPANTKLLNTANVDYSYYVDPNGALTNKTKKSDTTTVYVYDTKVSVDKSVDKSIAKVNDDLQFTITIRNDGSVSAEHVTFIDTLDSNISFKPGSIIVNNIPITYSGSSTKLEFPLSDIVGQGGTTTVIFSATIKSRPTENIIHNAATVKYTPNGDSVEKTMDSNITQTYVAEGELTVTKVVDKLYATVGDNLAYTVIVKNTGSVNATNLIFKDTIQTDALFINGTVIIDGTPQAAYNPNNNGFALNDLAPNQYHTVTFSVNVKSIPQDGKLNNTAGITFSYILPGETTNTKTTNSNTVTTNILLGNLSVTKVVDKAYATIKNTLNYTITIKNTGNAKCTDVIFRDIVQSEATFISGSVQINGEATAYNPNTGFSLPDIVGYGQVVVTFAVTVEKLPDDYTIYNFATDSYKYVIDPSNPPIVAQGNSNTVTTVINVGSLSATKAVSKVYATIDDILTYTISIVNSGNTVAKNVNFRDVIPTGLTLVSGSVTINGVSYQSYDPYASFTLGNISPGATVIIKFNAKVTSMPTPSLVSNTANIVFYYRIDPSGTDIPVQINSNTVTTQINLGLLTLRKSVDKIYSTMGYILTYTISVTNEGNVKAENVNFTDSLQSDITFNAGSVKVGDVSKPSADPNLGINLGDIETLKSVEVSFTVTVNEKPEEDAILNYAIGTFSYKVDPNGQEYTKSSQSNTVVTLIIKPSLSATKVVNKLYATLQDILNYSVLVKNSGNTTVSELFFSDVLSNGAVFKAGTVLVDGINYPTFDPIIGFNLPNELVAGYTSLVEFESTVTAVPSPPEVTNYGLSNGSYYIEPQGVKHSLSAKSNMVTTNIKVGSLSNVKSVDKIYVRVNETIRYTSTITNTGNVNATDLSFIDAFQAELSFVAGTVTINGVVYPSLDPTAGFDLSDLAPNQTVTVAFTAKVNALPVPDYVTNTSNVNFSYKINPNGSTITKNMPSNVVITYVILGKLNVTKIVDKAIATIGDVLTYTITLTNAGNVIDSSVLFQDVPTNGVTFKSGSVEVNGISQPNYDPTTGTGFSLGDIGIGNVVTVKFQVTVTSVPQTNQVTNQAIIPFKYTVDPKQQPYSDTAYSNTVTTNIAYGNLSVTKAVNKQYATIGEQITYTITITNIGNINATNVVFKDPIPHNTMFVIGSVTINGVSYPDNNPSAGFDLNTMTPGQIITVVYKVQVLKLC